MLKDLTSAEEDQADDEGPGKCLLQSTARVNLLSSFKCGRFDGFRTAVVVSPAGLEKKKVIPGDAGGYYICR